MLFNETCKRNFDLGNRKSRLCRACILRRVHDEDEKHAHAVISLLAAMDAARDFYAAAGIREKPAYLEVDFMYLQMLHHQIVTEARRNSSILRDGLIDNEEDEPLSGGRLMKVMERRLLAFPIEDRFD